VILNKGPWEKGGLRMNEAEGGLNKVFWGKNRDKRV